MRCAITSMLAVLLVLAAAGNARASDDAPPPPGDAPIPPDYAPIPPMPVEVEREATLPERPADDGWTWRATPPPPPVVAYTPDPGDEGKTLRIAGYAMLGAGYLISAWVGLMIYVINDDVEPSEDSDDVDRDEFWYLFIPVGGSLAYGISRGQEISTKDHLEGVGRFVGFILTIPTLVQSVGLCLAVAGHSKKKKASKRTVSLAATPVVGPDGSLGINLSGSF